MTIKTSSAAYSDPDLPSAREPRWLELEEETMKTRPGFVLLSTLAAVAAGAGILAPQSALAATSNCVSGTNNVCYWNSGSYAGSPTQSYNKTPADEYQWNISDNILSSAITRYSRGDYRWQITNSEGLVNRVLATLQKNTGVSLSGTANDNLADDMFFRIP